MTDKPTHRPMSRADWDATNEHARRVLHPDAPDLDANERLKYIRVRWGNGKRWTWDYDAIYQSGELFQMDTGDICALRDHLYEVFAAFDAQAAELRTARERVAALEAEASNLRKVYGIHAMTHHYSDEYVDALRDEPSAPKGGAK